MSEKENNVPVGEVKSTIAVVEQFSKENQEKRDYYARLVRQMCPTIAEDMPDRVLLLILHKRVRRLVEMFNLFERSWTDEIPVIQRACFQYMATGGLSKNERQKMVDA